ncbi:MAG: CPBP family intramembrane metalloprotease, partial [Clostridia bacterium]|nr:CPBP family intramembrane metalloprotease [Clostridia bacterium]
YRSLRKHSFFAGLCFLGYFALQEVLYVFFRWFGLEDAYLNNPAFQYASSALIFTIFSLGLPFYLYSRRRGRLSYIKALPFHTPLPLRKAVLLIVAGFGFCIVSNYVANAAGMVFDSVGIGGYTPEPVASTNALDVIMDFVCAAVVAPLVEEFVFRGVLMQPLRRYGDGFAVVATSVLFSLAHIRPANIVFAFGAGLVIGCAVLYSRSLWVGIIIHALNNGFSVFFTELEYAVPDLGYIFYNIACGGVVAAGIVALVVYGKSYGLKLRRNNSELSKNKRIRGFFFTVPMVLVLLYFAFIIVSNIISNIV